jgi:hypothetical protein
MKGGNMTALLLFVCWAVISYMIAAVYRTDQTNKLQRNVCRVMWILNLIAFLFIAEFMDQLFSFAILLVALPLVTLILFEIGLKLKNRERSADGKNV